MTENSKTAAFLILFGCSILLGACSQSKQQWSAPAKLYRGTFSDSTQVFEPCSEPSESWPSQGMEIFGLEKPVRDPWNSFPKVALEGKVRELIQSAEKIELLVRFDRNNPIHWKKKKAQQTKREDQFMFGNQFEYFRYLLPTLELGQVQFDKAQELLLRPDALLDGKNGPRFATVISGPRHVLRIQASSQNLIITISKINLPSIWISGESIDNFGGLIHPDIETEWHELIEEALGSSGYQ